MFTISCFKTTTSVVCSFRLAEKTVTTNSNIDDFEHILIPLSNIQKIIHVMEYIGGSIDINIENNQIFFISDKIYLTSRLINSSFPDYKQIIPKEHTTEVVVLKQDIVNILKNINVFSNKFNQINFYINPKEKTFKISSKNENIGEIVGNIHAPLPFHIMDTDLKFTFISASFL